MSDLPDKQHDERDAGVLSYLLFAWVWRLLRTGRKTTLQEEHLPSILPADTASAVYPSFRDAWHTPGHSSATLASRLVARLSRGFARSRTERAAYIAVADVFVRAALWKPLWIAASIGQIFAIRALVFQVQTRAPNKWPYVPVVIAMALCSVLMSISQHHLFLGSMRAGMRVRAALSSAIYRKVLRLSPASRASTSDGEITNLLLNDTHRILDSFTFFHFCWFGFIELALVSALLCLDLGVSALFGLLCLALLAPMQTLFSVLVGRARERMSAESDVRVHIMHELLSSIRLVKLSAWETRFEKLIAHYRARESKHLRVGAILRAIDTAIFFAAPLFVSLSTFTPYTLIFGKVLTPAIAFASVGFFSVLTRTLTMVPPGWLAISEASTAYKRFDAFFALSELPDADPRERFDFDEHIPASQRNDAAVAKDAMAHSVYNESSKIDDVCALLAENKVRVCTENAHFAWPMPRGGRSPDTAYLDEMHVVVSEVSVSVRDGELLAVVGHVGSGKSSLLLGLLGEIEHVDGKSRIEGSVAYCAQQPWISMVR